MQENVLANKIGLITKYSEGAWDTVYKAESFSSLLDRQSNLIKFDNARTVRVFKGALGGLGNYRRNNVELGQPEGLAPRGYVQSNLQATWETYTLTQDRAACYPIEYFDDEETAGLSVGYVVKESSRTVVIPEVDAYCFSKIIDYLVKFNFGSIADWTNPGTAMLGNLVIGNADNIATAPIAALNKGYKWLADNEVPVERQIVFASTAFDNALRETNELYRRLAAEPSSDKSVSFHITNYEGRRIVVVPPQRFGVLFATNPINGYHFADDDPYIDFIVMDQEAAVHVVKYNKVKTLTGEAALAATNMDAIVVYVRIYHDVFVFDNRIVGIYAHVGGFTTPKFNDFSLNMDKKGLVTAVLEKPSGSLIRVYKTTRVALPSVGDNWTTDATTDSVFGEGSIVSASGTIHLVGVQGGRVCAVKDLVVSGSAGNFTYTLGDHSA